MCDSTSSPKVPSLFVLFAAFLCLVATAFAQGNLSDMPSVERVKTEIKGSDPTDTLARQAAVFIYLQTIIDRIKYNRTVRGPYTPEEQKLRSDYSLAAYQISQDYAKTHTPDEAKAFERLHGQYEMDGAFYKDWSTRLIGKQATATYNNTLGEMGTRQQAHYNQEMDQYKKDTAAMQEANRQIYGNSAGMSQDPTAVATRRCLELGGSSMACMGKGIGAGFMGLIGVDTSELMGPEPAGVVLHGLFKSAGTKTTLGFNSASVAFGNCGTLDEAGAPYTVEKRPGAVRIIVHNEPAPFTLAMRPDGGLVGPGPVDITGRVIVGYNNTTTQYYRDGASVGAGYAAECGGPCRTTTSTPIYKPKTERCTIGSYNAPSPPPPSTPQSEAPESSGLMGMLTGVFDTGEMKWPIPPGLRMTGQYSNGRMLVEFSPATVIVDCGEAHVRLPYTVENTADRFLVHIDNSSGGAFTLAVEPDNILRGTGSTTVVGRLVSGMQGENVTFRPHSETCEVGAFRPKTGSPGTTKVAGGATAAPAASVSVGPSASASAPATYAAPAPSGAASGPLISPAASSAMVASSTASRAVPTGPARGTEGTRAAMRVLISSQFDGGANPMAGEVVWVMRDRMDAVLRSLGAPIPANATPAQAWATFATACKNTNCSPLLAQLKTHVVTATKLDAAGKATISTQSAATGTYYLFAQVRATDSVLVWDLPANLSAGDNNVTFTAANAEKFRTQAPAR